MKVAEALRILVRKGRVVTVYLNGEAVAEVVARPAVEGEEEPVFEARALHHSVLIDKQGG